MSTSPAVKTTVLIVDDELSIRRYLEVSLEESGYDLTVVASTAEANAILEERTFDIMLVDKNLGDGNGIELARQVGKMHPRTKTLLMTADADLNSAVEALRLGVADYITKPVDIPALEARLAQLIEIQRLESRNFDLLREIEALAVRDPLTKLFNHVYMQERLTTELARAHRNQLRFSFLLLGIDHFKKLNNDLGHSAGDKVMQTLAKHLDPRSWGSDSTGWLRRQDVVARFGDDRFALLLPETSKRGATSKADSICGLIASADSLSDGMPPVTVSAGVAEFPSDAATPNDIIEAAAIALRAAKKAGRNQAVAFSNALAKRSTGELKAEELSRIVGLRDTISDDLVSFVYQPIMTLGNGQGVFGYEALCRPQHSCFENPLVLIDTAEKAGKMVELGRVLRRESVRGIAHIPDEATLFINLHPHELGDEQFTSLEPALLPHAHRIVFEITETAAIRDFERLRRLMEKMRDNGFRFALDDLGSGYSGLNSLAQLEPEFVKLDRSLVNALHKDKRAARLVRHLVEFANAEGLDVIAEGIETTEQLDSVRELGCALAQGFFFGRGQPMPSQPH
jgi:diguanylate cyclase (GGDEF)-like protein